MYHKKKKTVYAGPSASKTKSFYLRQEIHPDYIKEFEEISEFYALRPQDMTKPLLVKVFPKKIKGTKTKVVKQLENDIEDVINDREDIIADKEYYLKNNKNKANVNKLADYDRKINSINIIIREIQDKLLENKTTVATEVSTEAVWGIKTLTNNSLSIIKYDGEDTDNIKWIKQFIPSKTSMGDPIHFAYGKDTTYVNLFTLDNFNAIPFTDVISEFDRDIVGVEYSNHILRREHIQNPIKFVQERIINAMLEDDYYNERGNFYANDLKSDYVNREKDIPPLTEKNMPEYIVVSCSIVEGWNYFQTRFTDLDFKVEEIRGYKFIKNGRFIFALNETNSRLVDKPKFVSAIYDFLNSEKLDKNEFYRKFSDSLCQESKTIQVKLENKIKTLENTILKLSGELGEITFSVNLMEKSSTKLAENLLQKIEILPFVDSMKLNSRGFIVITKEIYNHTFEPGKPRYIGIFEISVKLIKQKELVIRNIAAPSRDSQIPHASSTYICMGGFNGAFQTCLTNLDYVNLMLTAFNMIQHVTKGHMGAESRMKKYFTEYKKPSKPHIFSKGIVVYSNNANTDNKNNKNYQDDEDDEEGDY